MQSQKQQAQQDVQLANATLAQAQISVDSANATLQRAIDVKSSPNTFDPQVIAAQSAMTSADLNLVKAKADSDLAIATLQAKIDADQGILFNIIHNVNDNYATIASRYSASLELQTDQLNLQYQQDLANSYSIPSINNAKNTAMQTLQSLLNADDYAVTQANNTYQIALSNLKVSQERLNQANVALQAINITLSKYALAAPISGVIVTKNANIGELAQPGAAIYTIADISQVTLDVYVSESKIGLVKIGQKAEATVDSYPGQIFPGVVSYISPRAEYTPQNVQTQGQHLETLAFTVKITLNNPDYKLKEGVAVNANILVSP
jgi:HlyD family secretion protein